MSATLQGTRASLKLGSIKVDAERVVDVAATVNVMASIDLARAPAGQAYVLLDPTSEAVLTNTSPVREVVLDTAELVHFASAVMLVLPPADGACMPPFYVTESTSEGDGLALCSDAVQLGGFMTDTSTYGESLTIPPGESVTLPVKAEIEAGDPEGRIYRGSDLTEEKAKAMTELVNTGKAAIALTGDANPDGVLCPGNLGGIRWASVTDLAGLCPSLKMR